MKQLILFAAAALPVLTASAQKNQTKPAANINVTMTREHWDFQEGKVEFLTYKGQQAMKIAQRAGQVVLKDLVFKDGTIEYDIEPVMPEFAESIYFHRKDQKEQEIVYLRAGKIGDPYSNDGIQYAPYFDGVNMWDMYPQYQAPAPAKTGEWNHLKLVISGKQMRVFVNGKMVLGIPKLEGTLSEGSLAFDGSSYIANLVIKPGETGGLSPEEGFDLTNHEANYIRNWSVTEPAFLPAGREPTSMMDLPKNESFTGRIEAERAGLVNLTRRFGGNPKRRIVWLRTTIKTKEAVNTTLRMGFSDEVWVYLNSQLTYVDKNLFMQNMKKYPDGRISVLNGSFALALKSGENDLMIGVSNDFYGWGIMARLESTDGITQLEAYNPPPKIPIEHIEQYLGLYSSKSIALKLTFVQQDGELIVQPANQDPVPLSYAGHDTFKNERLGLELTFKPAEKKLMLKQGMAELEFVKDE